MHYDVIDVRATDHLKLAVRSKDGLTGEVELRESHLIGVFEALRDPAVFRQVRCDSGFVEWPQDLDLAPDAMYEQIKARGRWVLE